MNSTPCIGKPADRPFSLRVAVTLLTLLAVSIAKAQQASTAPIQGSTAETTALAIPVSATPESLFIDFLHYARLGRFTAADAHARALLAHPELDPRELAILASKDKKSIDTLLIIIRNSTIADSARRVLELVQRGEHVRRQDVERIQNSIDLLAGDPQQEFFGRERLADSGEYAVPIVLQTLLDPGRSALWPRLIRALPRIGKPAVNPLVMALAVRNANVRLNLIEALGEIGYPQAIPYLLKLMIAENTPADARDACARAIARIEELSGRPQPGSPDDHFHRLAEAYYNEDDSVRADPRLSDANIWYWDDDAQGLNRVVVNERIFGPLMAMRCEEEALLLRPDHSEAIALWLAANIRRESRLGLNVEIGDPAEQGALDPTRPQDFPRSLYFSQAAGPRYLHRVLARAVAGQDSSVALGAIEALRTTAGPASLIGQEDLKQPLVLALQFPDQVVRIRAALAIGAALPKSPFPDSQFVIPVLASALAQTGREQVLVVDTDESNLNRVAAAVRSRGMDVIAEKSFLRGLQRARTEFQLLTAVIITTDSNDPPLKNAVASLRGEFIFARTPVVVLSRRGQSGLAVETAKSFPFVESLDAAADENILENAIRTGREQAGQTALPPDVALAMALEAAETLRSIAIDGRTVFDFGGAEPALIGALASNDERLQITAASVLALARTATAQRAVAHVALDEGNSETLRIATFGSLAESARNHGNALEEAQVARLILVAREEKNLTLRTAASQALGAINLANNRASEIIRGFYGG
jgi:HEAT repeat protein